jgi:hypothetical protein
MTVRVVSAATQPVEGSIDVEASRLLSPRSAGMGLKNLRVSNADNGKPAEGALWAFKADKGVLLPGEKTQPRVLRFASDGGIPQEPDGYFEPTFNIYGRRLR